VLGELEVAFGYVSPHLLTLKYLLVPKIAK
jgi:hypothetical protein